MHDANRGSPIFRRAGADIDPDSVSQTIDPIDFEVMRNGLVAVANEMCIVLQRAAYSTNIKTRLDFSCALFDKSARMIAQSFSIPIHLGSLTHFVPKLLDKCDVQSLRPGDLLISNDGHQGGVHLNDVCIVAPVFWDEEPVAFVAALAHHIDVGGATPGSMGLAREVFEEGLIIPPLRLTDEGRLNENIVALILRNVRSPRETGGDLRAQIAASTIGARRLRDIIAKYSLATFRLVTDALLDYTERRVRAELASLPNGVYEAEGCMDGDGHSDEPVPIRVVVSISDDRIVYDLSGSAAQRPGPINATYAMTLSNCAYTLRALLDPDLPTNDGLYRVLEIIAPQGTVVNAEAPAAISCGWETGFRVCETAFLALAQAVPEQVAAGSKGCLCNILFGGTNPRTGEYFAFYESMAGGYGARATKDGIDAIQPHVQNTENSPVEETEANYPVRILRYELIPNSEGAGTFRGGLGLRRDYAFETDVIFTVLADRHKSPPWGLAGGYPASTAEFVRNPDSSKAQALTSKFSINLACGETFSVRMAGGGGFGPPELRDPTDVLDDVVAGKISRERAEDIYGVEIHPASQTIDTRATSAKRAVMTSGRGRRAKDASSG